MERSASVQWVEKLLFFCVLHSIANHAVVGKRPAAPAACILSALISDEVLHKGRHEDLSSAL